ncbi:MAG TPA: DUF2339 domain-containing protein [Chthoniobacterales bacterium]|nr:DUF2339 domain-containing protein [Chthoniobacterales bacterium]
MEGFFVCLGALVLIAPVIVIVIGAIQIQKLKSAVRHLVQRVGELESRTAGQPAPPVASRPSPAPPAVSAAQPVARPPAPIIPEPGAAQAPPPPPPPPARPTSQPPPVVPPAPPPIPAKPFDWEAFFGVKLFAWIGGFVLFLGIVFLVKYSFENNLITPAMRVLLGTVIGIGLIVTGWFTATRNFRVSGQSLCATGVLVLYGNIFAAHVYYRLISLTPAFASMALVTAVAFFLAVRMNAQVIVVLGLLGGFLTPVLLSTGVDHALALFGYIALLNAGVAAVALRKRWDYLVLVAAAGTILMEFAWAERFFEPGKANTAFAIFIVFEAHFLAIFAWARRLHAPAHWTARAAIAVCLSALAWGFCLLTYVEFGSRPGFLFTYMFVAEAGLLGLAFLYSKRDLIVPLAGGIVFAFLASWTADYLTSATLWWGLGGYVVYSIFHAGFAVWPRTDGPETEKSRWLNYLPLLPLVLIWMCVWKNQTASAVWLVLLVLDFVAIAVAIMRRSLAGIAIAVVLTFFAAFLWIAVGPTDLDLRSFLIVAAGSGVFFSSASIFAAQRFFPGSEHARRNIPALAVSLPFVLLFLAMAKLPAVNPTPYFIATFVLAALLLGLGVFARTSWIVLVALIFSWAIQSQWQALHFTTGFATLGLGWEVAFFLLFFAYPFFSAEEEKTLPWAIGALAGPLHFVLIYEIVVKAFPAFRNGLTPAAFFLPYAAAIFFLVTQRRANAAAGDSRLAWQGAAALFFVTLIFPIQFDREWVTLGWALEGLALVWLFRVVPNRGLRYVGVGLLCLAFVRLALNPAVLEYHRRTEIPIWNWYLYAYGITIVCLFFAGWLFRPPRAQGFERTAPTLLYSLGAILTFLLLNIEIADYFSIGPTLTFSFTGNFARDMTYSIAWALFAFGLLLFGMFKQTRWVRYSGVALLIVTLAKLFLNDLSNLSQLYRIGAFIGVAMVLIVASFVYQRFLVPKGEPNVSPPGAPPPPPPA